MTFQMCSKAGVDPAKPEAEKIVVPEGPASKSAASVAPQTATDNSPEEDPVAPHVIEDEPLVPEKIVTGVVECDDFIERYMACEALTDQAKIAMEQAFRAWKKAANANSGSHAELAEMCSATAKAQDKSMMNFGC